MARLKSPDKGVKTEFISNRRQDYTSDKAFQERFAREARSSTPKSAQAQGQIDLATQQAEQKARTGAEISQSEYELLQRGGRVESYKINNQELLKPKEYERVAKPSQNKAVIALPYGTATSPAPKSEIKGQTKLFGIIPTRSGSPVEYAQETAFQGLRTLYTPELTDEEYKRLMTKQGAEKLPIFGGLAQLYEYQTIARDTQTRKEARGSQYEQNIISFDEKVRIFNEKSKQSPDDPSLQEEYSVLKREESKLVNEFGKLKDKGVNADDIFAQKYVQPILPPYKKTFSQLPETVADRIERKFYTSLREDPTKFISKSAEFAVIGSTLSGIGSMASASGIIPTGKTAQAIGTGFGTAVSGLYGGSVALRTAQAPKGERAEKFAEIVALETAPMLIGGLAGTYGYSATKGALSTIGRQKVPSEGLIPGDVLSGRETFPSAGQRLSTSGKQKLHEELFLTQSQRTPIKRLKGYTGEYEYVSPGEFQTLPFKVPARMYHATGQRFYAPGEGFSVTEGASEFEGLFGSYGVSPRFLRLDLGVYSGQPKSIMPGGNSGIAEVIPQGFVRGTSSKPGTAFIPGNKAEVQAILPPTTQAMPLSNELYTTYKGVRVPIDTFKALPGSNIAGGKSVGEISSSYGLPSISASSPESLLIASAQRGTSKAREYSMPSTPSRPSMPSSRSPSYAPSFISVSSSPSAPSRPSRPSRPSSLSVSIAPSTPSKPSAPSTPSRPSRVSSPSKPSAPAFLPSYGIVAPPSLFRRTQQKMTEYERKRTKSVMPKAPTGTLVGVISGQTQSAKSLRGKFTGFETRGIPIFGSKKRKLSKKKIIGGRSLFRL